jgi:hypothetical protein
VKKNMLNLFRNIGHVKLQMILKIGVFKNTLLRIFNEPKYSSIILNNGVSVIGYGYEN